MLTEKQIESAVLDYLNALLSCFAFKVNTVGIYDKARKVFRTNRNRHLHNGTSDILGVYKGRMFAFEVKKPKSVSSAKTYPSKSQKSFLDNVIRCGGNGCIVRSIDDAMAFIAVIEKDLKC